MPLVDSLLTAIVRADGDALVMHAGEKPYVVATSGPVELSTQPLTLDAMVRMVAHLLPPHAQRALQEVGAVEHDLSLAELTDERFTLVAARGGDDVWVEIRRHRKEPSPPAAVRRRETTTSSRASGSGKAGEEPARRQPSWSESQPGVVLPMQRTAARPEPASQPPTATNRNAGLDRLLRLALARGASTLYVVAESRPMVRVDGEVASLDTERPLTGSEVETLLHEWATEPGPADQREEPGGESVRDVPDIGRVRCLVFHDHRGAGGIFTLIPTRALSADQLGLSREIQALTAQPDGLILVTGQRLSGKSTLLSAFVDLINRTRSDHVITLERQVKIVHESRRSFISQRELRGSLDDMIKMARAALREDPDVLVIADLGTPEILGVALEAAASGRLVIGALPAVSTSAAIERILDQSIPERRVPVQHALASTLRGVVSQVLLRKTGGGRLAARELMLNTPAIASLIAEGKTAQLPFALESGRKHGMVPLNDALAGFVQGGATEAREAYRKAFDREGLLNLLKRAGIDTSFVERLA